MCDGSAWFFCNSTVLLSLSSEAVKYPNSCSKIFFRLKVRKSIRFFPRREEQRTKKKIVLGWVYRYMNFYMCLCFRGVVEFKAFYWKKCWHWWGVKKLKLWSRNLIQSLKFRTVHLILALRDLRVLHLEHHRRISAFKILNWARSTVLVLIPRSLFSVIPSS